MDELDKLFKDKLADREFEFKDSYWEAAEQLLDQQDKRRKRGGFWWWIGASVLVIAIAAYFLINRNTTTTQTAQDLIENKNNELTDLEPDEKQADIIKSTQEENTQAEKEISTTEKQAQTQTNIQSKNAETKEERSLSSTRSEGVDEPTDTKGLNSKFQNNRNLDVIEEPIIINPPSSSIDSILQQKKSALERKEDRVENTEKVDELPLKKEEILNAENSSPVEELAFLETILSEIEIPEADCEDCFELAEVNKIPKYKRFHLGINAEGVFIPKGNNLDAGYGGAIGLMAVYKLKPRLSLRTGVQYSVIEETITKALNPDRGSFDPANITFSDFENYDFTVENQYGFGLRTVETIAPPQSYHLLEVPLVAQYNLKNHVFEAGLQLEFLLGVRAEKITNQSLFPWEQDAESSSAAEKQESEKVWLSKEDYNKFIPQLTAGYKYKISDQFSVGVNAFYNFNNYGKDSAFLEDSFVSLSENENLSLSNNLHLRLGLSWTFKK